MKARMLRVPLLLRDGRKAAELAKLRYVSMDEPGILRKFVRGKFVYLDAKGKTMKRPAELARIRALAIPPAWRDVWICQSADGHIQAVGRDARGRKQYRYHAAFRKVREEAKYHHLVHFGESLPALRERLERDLAQRELTKTKVIATVVKIMESTRIRVGNDRYAEDNGSFGLTTLLDRHATISAESVEFKFRGKGGKLHQAKIEDRRLASIVRRCRDIPGQRLFQYVDEQGRYRAITSSDVNEYLRRATGHAFTAKVFRTWAGTAIACLYLLERSPCKSQRLGQKAIVRAVSFVAEKLGNTVAICRKCYVHPRVCEAFLRNELRPQLSPLLARARRVRTKLRAEEWAVLNWLRQVATDSALEQSLARKAA